MTVLEHTYLQLKNAGLVRSTAGFSTQYFGRNSNWYSWQKHAERDMYAAAAIQCVRTIRAQLHTTPLDSTQRSALELTAALLLQHLRQRHAVADVC